MAPTSRHGLLANPKTKHIFPTMHSNLFDQIEEKCTYFSFLSNSLSSCRLRELPPVIDPSSGTTPDRGLDGLLNGVEVKQVFGLERGRSALTGVGFILLVGLDALRNNRSGQIVWKLHVQIYIFTTLLMLDLCRLTQEKWVRSQQEGTPPSCWNWADLQMEVKPAQLSYHTLLLLLLISSPQSHQYNALHVLAPPMTCCHHSSCGFSGTGS